MHVEQILQTLIRFDTTNPPGNERACIEYIKDLLEGVGLTPRLYAKDENRPNLVCKIEGRGEAPPIMMYGHVDVVTTSGQKWTHPPFEGEIIDGYLWGRGTIDMKGGIAMMVAAMLRLAEEGIKPAGDVIFMAVADEEVDGSHGAKFMVEEHPEVFEGVKYALGEIGGFNLSIGGKRFYPIQVAEKQICQMKIILEGPGGHASGVVPNNAMEKLGRVLTTLSKNGLPFHATPSSKLMINAMADALSFPGSLIAKMVLVPGLSELLLSAAGDVGGAIYPMLHNTVNPTIVHGGEKINVIPSKIELRLDGRMLPGFQKETMIDELSALVAEEGITVEVAHYEPGPQTVDMGLFDHLAGVLKQMDPEGVPVPFLLTAVTDGRFLSTLGIQSYGFIPMKLPSDFEFLNMAHAADERIPVEALRFGAEGIYQAMKTYQG